MVCDLSRLNSRQMLAPAMALALAISCFVAPEGLAEEKGLKATSKVASQPRAKVLEQLAVKLQQQRRDLEISNNPISKANLAKLHPALQRQKMILLSRKVLAVDPNSKTVLASSASDSDLVVGSIKPANAAPQKVHPLARFYRSLNALKSKSKAKQITVLHIAPEGSDSAQFANNIRTGLNDIYGDAGHGMVSPAHSSRQSGRDGFQILRSGKWNPETYRLRNKAGFGLSGTRLSSRSSLSSMSFVSQSGPFDWAGVTIATGPSQGTFTLKVGDLEQKFDAHAKSAGSRLFRLDARGTEATVVPGGGAKTAIMSWHSGKTNPGIRYVDFQLSKSRADTIGEGLYDAAMIRNDVHQISPDLVIIDRTSSALSGAEADRDTKKQFDDLVAQIRASAPQAEVLVLNEDSGAGLTVVGSCRTAAKSQLAIDHPALGGRVKSRLSANWHFTSTASDPCSIDHQLKQALALARGVDQQPEISQLRAKALVKWLTGPAKSQPVLARR